MTDFFKEINSDLSASDFKQLSLIALNDSTEVKNQISNKLAVFKQNFSEVILHKMYHLLNLFDEQNEITEEILRQLLDLYFNDIDNLINRKLWDSIELVIDMFYHNPEAFTSDVIIRRFVEKSIPLLEVKEVDIPISAKEIATGKLIDILLRMSFITIGSDILLRFIKDNPTNVYAKELAVRLK